MVATLEATSISKRFGGVEALRGIDLSVETAEGVGLVGDNGAGKSTLAKIVAGALQPDGGRLTFEGHPVRFTDPAAARARGIETVYQDLALVETMDTPSNIFLGREPLKSFGMVDRTRMRRDARTLLKRLGVHIDSLDVPVRSLSGGQRQSIAMCRALSVTPKLVILDEPTAALALQEVDRVLEQIRTLKQQGVGVILISHTLQHVFAVADRIIVLRRGIKILDVRVQETTLDDVVKHIVGGAS